MTQQTDRTATRGKLPVCLSGIRGAQSVTARLPTAAECQYHDVPAGTPVLIVRCEGGRELLYRADLVTLLADSGPPPAPDAAREAARYIAVHILEDLDDIREDLDNIRADLTRFCAAIGGQPGEMVKLADELRQWRADDLAAAPDPATLWSGR